NQLFGAIKPVKVHRAEEHMIARFWTHSERFSRLNARIPLFQNGPRYLIEPIAFGGLVVIVIYLAVQGRDFSDVLPNLGVMAFAGYRLLPAMQLLYGQLTQITTMRHTLDEVYDEFREAEQFEEEQRDSAARTGHFTRVPPLQWEKEIRLSNLSFTYPGNQTATLDKVNLTIPKNTSLAVVGPTGSGKSTLVDLVLGLLRPTGGELLIDGQPLTPENIPAWRAGIGYVPQDIVLLDDTLARNIAFGVPDEEIDPARLESVCRSAQIFEFIQSELPQKFQTITGERGVRLSGGQKQRIGLARALYHNPTLLVLDEATSALDTKTEDGVMQAIASLSG
ncbi:MAG: ABC transporter ATP-binding protein, partial [Actinomycetota bacterium]